MKLARTAVFLCLLGVPASAQEGGLGLADGRGSFYSVTNRAGRRSYFQITKLTLAGGVLWNLPYDPGQDVQASVISVDKDGALLVAGTIKAPERDHVLLAKFSPFGAFQWRQTHDAAGDPLPTALGTDHEGNSYVVATISERDGSFLRVLRYGPQGNYFWGANYRAGVGSYGKMLTVDPNGDARVTSEVCFGDLSRGKQTRQVVFTTYGAVVPQ